MTTNDAGAANDAKPMTLLLLYTAILGACIGSFLNVVIYRLPRRLRLVRPGSQCPHCNHPIPWHYKVPVLSYLWLRGRCAYCGHAISPCYLLLELGTAGIFVLLTLVVGPSSTLVLHLVLIAVLLAAAEIDRIHRILPNNLLLSGSVLALVLLALLEPGKLLSHVAAGGISLAGGLALRHLTLVVWRTPGLGMGDVKLFGMVGLFLGGQVAGVAYLAFFLGGLLGLAGLLTKRLARSERLPFGPFVAASALLYPLLHPVLMAWMVYLYA